ncbi:Probable terpene synthase 3 [Linum grandiflorum]
MAMAAVDHEPLIESGRRRVEFHPSVWNDFFAQPNTSDLHPQMMSGWKEEAKELTEKVRGMLNGAKRSTTLERLEMIDAVQRLGIGYRFELEIEEALLDMSNPDEDGNEDLYYASLRFRLLRQQGYPVNPAVFEKFKDEKGDFKEEVGNDVKGLLSLYEAAYFRRNGEELLDEALEFARAKLEPIAESADSPWASQVKHSLKWPILKGLPIRESRHFMTIYQKIDGHSETILKLGKLDFNLVQKLHQHELKILTKWWMDLDTEKTLPFARDRVIECYMWPLGGFIKPEYSTGRIFVTKITALISILDDIFDVHGTIRELELVAQVIERWEITDEDKIPSYVKFWFKALLDVFAEIEAQVSMEGRSFCMDYAKEGVKQIVRAFLKEARWYNKGYVATVEEHLENGYMSIGYPLAITVIYCGMGEVASKEVFEWLFSQPKIVVAGSTIARLMDDIVSHEFEQERGHVASSVECYMKQHGASKEEAHSELNKLVEKLWKDMNEDMLVQPPLKEAPMPALLTVLNKVRVMDLLYKDEDTYTNSKTVMKELLTSLLVDPVPI